MSAHAAPPTIFAGTRERVKDFNCCPKVFYINQVPPKNVILCGFTIDYDVQFRLRQHFASHHLIYSLNSVVEWQWQKEHCPFASFQRVVCRDFVCVRAQPNNNLVTLLAGLAVCLIGQAWLGVLGCLLFATHTHRGGILSFLMLCLQ